MCPVSKKESFGKKELLGAFSPRKKWELHRRSRLMPVQTRSQKRASENATARRASRRPLRREPVREPEDATSSAYPESDEDVSYSPSAETSDEDIEDSSSEEVSSSEESSSSSSVASNEAIIRRTEESCTETSDTETSEAESSDDGSVTLGSETRSEDSESTSLSGFIVRDDDPALLDEASSSMTDVERARALSDRVRSVDEELAEILRSLRNPRRG